MSEILAVDIGYSNLKMCIGNINSEPTASIYPAGAAPVEHLSNVILPGSQGKGVSVTVGDRKFKAGIQQGSAGEWARVLEQNYSKTDDYKALYYASLLYAERDEIDLVVTGLPTYQCSDKERVDEIKAMMIGEHQITPERKVTVKKVEVFAQPVGAFMDLHSSSNNKELLEKGKVLVVDPGFFSVDWVLINQGAIEMTSSSSSKKAVSVILSEATPLIEEDFGACPQIEELEKAVRDGSYEILVLGKKVDINKYLEKASIKTASIVVREIRNNLRRVDTQPDVILLAGGGAQLYESSIREEFGDGEIIIPNDSVFSNVRGYWFLGRS